MGLFNFICGHVKPSNDKNKNSGVVYYNRHHHTYFFKYVGKNKSHVLIEEYNKDGKIINRVKVPKKEIKKPLSKMDSHDMKDLVYYIPYFVMKYRKVTV